MDRSQKKKQFPIISAGFMCARFAVKFVPINPSKSRNDTQSNKMRQFKGILFTFIYLQSSRNSDLFCNVERFITYTFLSLKRFLT